MKLTITKWFALAAFVLLCAANSDVFAQGLTTAAINGKVTSKTGEALPGANVIAVHVPSGTIYGTTTRENGEYNLPGLRVGGPYTLTTSFVGYNKQERTNIQLQLSQNIRQDFVLTEQAIQAGEVVVTGERSAILSAAHSGAATNVLRDQIDKLPTLSRTFQDYYKTSPYFASGSSVLGRNNKYNNIQIDGADFNDLFGLGGTGTPGGQSSVTPISLDALEEFQIVVSPFDVRQAGFTGAGINAITRSGTNTIKGSAFYYGRNENLSGVSPDAAQTKLPAFTDYSAGFRLGGPVIENKLFYFVTGEISRRDAPFSRTFNNSSVGTNAYTVLQDSINLLTNYLKTKYNYDPGSWTSVPQIDNSDKIFLRFDYNLSENHKLTARWNYLSSTNDNSPSRFRGTLDIFSENGRYKLVNKTHSIAVQLTSLFGNTASNELIFGYNDQFDNPVYYGQPFPTLEVRSSNPAASDTRVQRLGTGAEEFRHQNELGQKHLEITDNFSYFLPNHTITVGAKADIFKFRNLFIPDNFGAYVYTSIADFINDRKASSYTFRYSATSNPLQEANWGARQFGLYAQDEWTVSPALKITAGVRLDIPTYPDSPNYNARFDSTFTARGYNLSTTKLPENSVAVSPRVGFNWAVDEDRNTQLRGGLGIFYGKFPYVWVSNQYSNTGVDYYTVTTVPTNFIADPYGQPKIAGSLPTAEVDITDPSFKAPSILRYDFGVDQKLPFDIVASVEAIYSKSINEVYYQNLNLRGLNTNGGITPNGRLVGENREVWAKINTTTGAYLSNTGNANERVVNPAFTAVYLVKNTDQGSNTNITVQLQRQNTPDGIYANLAYTYGYARDIGGSNSTTASSGWRFNPSRGNPNDPALSFADNDRRHRLLAVVSYRYDWGYNGLATTFGLLYNGLSGSPFSYMVSGDVNGDGLSDNDLAYIPKDANDVILVTSAGVVLPKTDDAYTQLLNYINNDDYLKDHKGEIAERNAARSPWTHQVDLRINQEIPTIAGQKIELTFDIINVANLLNKEWGWQKFASETPLLTFHSITPSGADAGKARYRWLAFNDPNVASNLRSRWAAQFGIRYTF